MQLQGLKNLPKLGLFCDDSFQNLAKKLDESRKGTKGAFEHLEVIIKNSESFCIAFEKILQDFNGGGLEGLRNI